MSDEIAVLVADLKAQLDRIEKKLDLLLEIERLSPTKRIVLQPPNKPTAYEHPADIL
jgi:hypothetical protein